MRSIVLSAVLAMSAIAVPSAASAAAPRTSVVLRTTGSPWLHVHQDRTVVRGATAEARALTVVQELSAAARATTLTPTAMDRFADGDVVVRLEQSHRGLPVIGRGAAVRMSAKGEAILSSISVEDTLPSSIVPVLSAADAATRAGRFSRLAATASDAHLVVWPTHDGSRLAWVVLPRVPTGMAMAPRVVVDAENGTVLQARDLVTFAKANMYASNPTKSPQLQSLELPLAPDGAKLSNAFLKASNCVDNKTVKPVDFFGFKMNVHVCDLTQLATANGAGDYIYTPSDEPGSAAARKDEFSEVSMYYHAGRAYQFFRGLQGDASAQVVVDKPLTVIANLQLPPGAAQGSLAGASDPNKPLDPFQNAFFSPAGGGLGSIFAQLYGFDQGALWFGQGPQRDYSYDGDVVYHEFTHAVVDATLKLGAWHIDARGAIDSPGAMNEGLADYFSSALTGDPDVGEYASKDFAAGMSVIRTLANNDKCPTEIAGEVHYDSTLFSGGMWTARASLSPSDQTKFDAAIYKAMRTNPGDGDLGFEDVTKLFLTTLGTDLPAGAAALEKAMTDRGVLPSCERIISYGKGAVRAPNSGLGGFSAPGTATVGTIKDLAPGLIQIKVATAPGPVSVTVTWKPSADQGGGGANPLGGGGTPFAPVLLAKAGKPITWSAKGLDADVTKKADKTGATIELPNNTSDAVYLQIANSGESDGTYDQVAVTVTALGAPPATTEPATPDPATTDGTANTGLQDDSGCATTPARAKSPLTYAAVLGLATALGLVARRRRRF